MRACVCDGSAPRVSDLDSGTVHAGTLRYARTARIRAVRIAAFSRHKHRSHKAPDPLSTASPGGRRFTPAAAWPPRSLTHVATRTRPPAQRAADRLAETSASCAARSAGRTLCARRRAGPHTAQHGRVQPGRTMRTPHHTVRCRRLSDRCSETGLAECGTLQAVSGCRVSDTTMRSRQPDIPACCPTRTCVPDLISGRSERRELITRDAFGRRLISGDHSATRTHAFNSSRLFAQTPTSDQPPS